MSVEETQCQICGTKQSHMWRYTNDVKGDTTFETPSTAEIIERARRMVQQAMETAIKRRFTLCLTRPPGHHACSDKKRKGFCHHNFIIDALDMCHQKGLNAIIVDIDAHHGDGTEFEVLQRSYGQYASIHGFGPNVYPGTGGSSIDARICNVPLHAKAGTAEWLDAWHKQILPFVRSVSPDILLLSCGLDAHEMDTLAPLRVTTECYTQIGKDLQDLRIPVFAVLEGGYCLSAMGTSVKEIVKAFLNEL